MKKNYFTLKKNKNSNITFGFFTRNNGFSEGKFSSLNCSVSSGDDKKTIIKNINFAKKQLNLEKKKLKLINQVHSNKVVVINNKNFNNQFQADGLISKNKNICIGVLTADCCPIFIYDTANTFVSCIHSGWKGSYLNIIQNALKKIAKIQPNLDKVRAVIGPCLHKNNFEVDKNFITMFQKKESNNKYFFNNSSKKNSFYFDMKKLIKFQLKNNGILNVKDIDLDTYSNKKLFFSHRRSCHKNEVPTGRMINIIGFDC